MKTILVVDDDKLNLSAARKVLSGEYKVIPLLGEHRHCLIWKMRNVT